MSFLADLHIHSHYSRATSPDLTLAQLHTWAQRKGLAMIGTGDVTHPAWLEEIETRLIPAEEGLFQLRPDLAREVDASVPQACRHPVRFVLQGEVSSICRHSEAVRRVHNLVFFPTTEAARAFQRALERTSNIRSDGRPILGLSSRTVLELLLQAGSGSHLVPAHIWTPWYSLLGSRSGYDSIDNCFEDLAGEIFALETGLSSDPPMNRRVSALDRFTLISSSDAHSPANLGREASEFDCPLSYPGLFHALRGSPQGDPSFLGTVEFFPEEGKYHHDGHRNCGVGVTPRETREREGLCPACGKPLTVGVLHRVEELADRPADGASTPTKPFSRLVSLAQILGECLGKGPRTQSVGRLCERLLTEIGPELHLLRKAPLDEISRVAGPTVGEAIRRVREERLAITPGYDGRFGKIRIFDSNERIGAT